MQQTPMQQIFHSLTDHVTASMQAGEEFALRFSGERSDFVRFNHARVRQAGQVTQQALSLRLIRGSRHASAELVITGDPELDRAALTTHLEGLRESLPHLPEDPHMCLARQPESSAHVGEDSLVPAQEIIQQITAQAAGMDLVGIYAGGGIRRGFASSSGQRNWFSVTNFNLDYCLCLPGNRAVKDTYAGLAWDPESFDARLDRARTRLEILGRPARRLKTGSYRVALSPTALGSILEVVAGWGGFSARSLQTRSSPLQRLQDEARLDPRVTLRENGAAGLHPRFQGEGFIRPERIDLVTEGALDQPLVSPRSAREFSLQHSGADRHERPVSLEMAAGNLPAGDVLETLGTGIEIGNLWYLNFSDLSGGRITGMTRFATFWVEDGRIVAPIEPMRFDETVYAMLGDKLVALTAERELQLSSSTYFQRSTSSTRMPGGVIEDMPFPL